MGKMNQVWHKANRMPAKATLEQRIRWHREHAANCACRPIPAGLQAEVARRGLAPS